MCRAVLSPKEERWWLGSLVSRMMSPTRCGSDLWWPETLTSWVFDDTVVLSMRPAVLLIYLFFYWEEPGQETGEAEGPQHCSNGISRDLLPGELLRAQKLWTNYQQRGQARELNDGDSTQQKTLKSRQTSSNQSLLEADGKRRKPQHTLLFLGVF